ncbi:TipAS antibiotic-recognition domain-containing protein [Microbispora amethystogenes]|uniref:TipAS antibiotic-recognition domain-containing protein n=1 Tax=Microbispora amethystogenes TaxID=1427754 RepID=A0ABQ4FI28_9ACTN|nr:TipAS antibiotic-recognition domain-containing protein [Microbispora amethystogenes]GIH34465.1 hypothetical protein Mam01_46290 [Microbispora amethystogenes]
MTPEDWKAVAAETGALNADFAADPRFAAHYDAVTPGLAVWLRDTIRADAEAHGVNPESATWRCGFVREFRPHLAGGTVIYVRGK